MDTLAAVCDRVASRKTRQFKVRALAEWLRTLPDADLKRALRFLSGLPGEHRLRVGSVLLREAAMAVTGWDLNTVRLCYGEVGDVGETIGLLLEGRTANEAMTLAEAERMYMRLAAARGSPQKVALLTEAFRRYRAPAIKYFVKIMRGNLRIGIQKAVLEEALEAAARSHALDKLDTGIFHLIEFMQPTPLYALDKLGGVEHWWIECEYGGTRAQLHAAGGEVRILGADGKSVTRAFPEIVEAARRLPGRHVIDGEVVDWRANEGPIFVATDLLHSDGELLVDAPIEARRARLSELFADVEWPLMESPLYSLSTEEEVKRFFEQACSEGYRGLILKRRLSSYEGGSPSGAWLRMEPAQHTVDVVVTSAAPGTGRHATTLCDYTFGVSDGERFVNIGRALAELPDEQLRKLTRLLRGAATERFGRMAVVRPLIVLQVAFEGVQKSPRHKSGYALRFPRIVRWRADKRPEEADTLERIRELHDAAIR